MNKLYLKVKLKVVGNLKNLVQNVRGKNLVLFNNL